MILELYSKDKFFRMDELKQSTRQPLNRDDVTALHFSLKVATLTSHNISSY